MENCVTFFLFVSSLQIYFVLIEVLMDCYQHCVEGYGISLSDKNGKSAKGCYCEQNNINLLPLFGLKHSQNNTLNIYQFLEKYLVVEIFS